MKNILNNILQWISITSIVLLIPFSTIAMLGEIFGVRWIEKLLLDIGLSYNFFSITSLILIAIFVIINFISCNCR